MPSPPTAPRAPAHQETFHDGAGVRGFLRLLTRRKKLKLVRRISANVLPKYQRWGLWVVTLARLVPDAPAWGIQEAEFSWVLESNHLSYRSLKRGGAKRTKTCRMDDVPAPD